MRALDVYSEKSLRDGNHDKQACSAAFISEVQSIAFQRALQKHDKDDHTANIKLDKTGKPLSGDFNDATGMGQRDKMALASIAFCSPLMLLGMGAAMGIADEFRSMNKANALKDNPAHRLRQSAAAAEQGLKGLAREKSDAPIKKTMLSMEPRTGVPSLKTEARKSKLEFANRKENVLYPSNGSWRQSDGERSWVKASKLVKRKQHLMDQLEKFRGMLNLSLVSSIVSKIERLDKELKKMGC